MQTPSLPPLPLEDGALFIDNSGWMEGLSTCDRLVEYKQLYKRIPASDKPALSFGSAVHIALEYRYKRYQNRPVDEDYYNTITSLLTDHFAAAPCPEDDYRTLNWAIELIKRYNQRYAFEEFNLLTYKEPVMCPHCDGTGAKNLGDVQPPEDSVVPCPWCQESGKQSTIVELPFAVPLFTWSGTLNGVDSSIPIIYSGKIDMPVVIDNKLYGFDHKTTSILGPTFWEEKKMSAQQKGYCWALQECLHTPVHGFIINAIRTKQPPQYVTNGTVSSRGKNQSPDQWWHETFARQRFVLFEPSELQEWKENTIQLVSQFLEQYSRGYLPMKTTWCVGKYGKCPYFEVCSTQPASDRPLMLSSGLYMDNTWSPLRGSSPTQSKQ